MLDDLEAHSLRKFKSTVDKVGLGEECGLALKN